MQPKPGLQTTEFWVSFLATAGSLIGGLAGVLPGPYAAIAAAVSAGAYAISRGLAKQPAPVTNITPASGARMLPLAAVVALSLGMLGLTGCSSLSGFFGGKITPDEVSALTQVAVSNALAFGVKDPSQRATVAREMEAVSTIYITYSNGSVPTPEQFQGLLNAYLPAGDSKAITVSNVTALYTLRYSSFKDFKLPEQIAYLTAFLNGVKIGAAPYAGAP